jgi:phi LC3 family holin
MKNKYKNVYFWLGLVAVVFAAAGVDVEMLTTWSLLRDSLLEVLLNPFRLGTVVVAIIGVFNDNGTKGLDKLRR